MMRRGGGRERGLAEEDASRGLSEEVRGELGRKRRWAGRRRMKERRGGSQER